MTSGPQGDRIALEMRSVKKAFGNMLALEDVSFSCRYGEVQGLVGENGAGKSTLMKILAGELQPDEGMIFIKGERVEFKNPRQAREKGISLIHQEFSLVPYLTVAENIFLGSEPRNRLGLIDSRSLHRRSREILDQLQIDLELEAVVASLSLAQKQLVEIAKSLQTDPQILIMDEPTAALERPEIENLFALISRIKAQGRTVVFISHRLEEVFEITDHISVLRNGQVIGTFASSGVTKDELIEAIIGRKLGQFFPPKSKAIGRELLRLKGLIRDSSVRGVDLSLRGGEILGLAGLEGQGQHVLLRALFGADLSVKADGEVTLNDQPLDLSHPRCTIMSGLGYVPGDRQAEGLILNLSVADNISLPGLAKRTNCGLICRADEAGLAQSEVKTLAIKVSSLDTPVKTLSGGNQQKVVLAKWLASDTDIFILDEPTRGVDIGTRAEIYGLMRELANQGKAIVMSSRDLDEVIGMSDRVAVVYRGKIIREYEADSCSKEHILDIITRVPEEEIRGRDLGCD